MKSLRVLFLLLFLIGLVGCQRASEPLSSKDGVFLHISSGYENPHRVLMALKMAEIMSDSKDVLVYFDIRGIDVVLKNSVDMTFSHFPSSHTQIRKLLEKKITIMACPGCLKAAGKTKEDLMEGIQIADKEAFFKFTKGRILTLDY